MWFDQLRVFAKASPPGTALWQSQGPRVSCRGMDAPPPGQDGRSPDTGGLGWAVLGGPGGPAACTGDVEGAPLASIH